MSSRSRLFLVIGAPLLLVGLLSACGDGDDSGHPVAMASLDGMPPAVRRAPKAVREAYQFAVANPEVLSEIPCYCGCGGMGHTSIYSCYVRVTPQNTAQFDGHALGCSICVDIALDAMRLLRKGSSVPEIRLYVDAIYAKYGPSNMT